MAKKIDIIHNRSLSELEIIPGQIVAFDNNNPDWPSQFLLAIPEKIVRGFEYPSNGINLYFSHIDLDYIDKKTEKWTLYAKGEIVGLWSLGYAGKEVTEIINPLFHSKIPDIYYIEYAYSGIKAIRKALMKYSSQGMNLFYTSNSRLGESAKKGSIEEIVDDFLGLSCKR